MRGGRGGGANKRRVVESSSASSSDARSDLDGDASYGRSEEEAEIDEVVECENDSASAKDAPVEEVDLTGPANNEAKDESDGESEKIEAVQGLFKQVFPRSGSNEVQGWLQRDFVMHQMWYRGAEQHVCEESRT